MKTINITCENTQQDYEVELGTTLRDVKKNRFSGKPPSHSGSSGKQSTTGSPICSNDLLTG